MNYFGSKLSPHLVKTGEGYLICMDVPIARTGIQKYLPEEIQIENAREYTDSDGMIPVYREPEEVFSTATLASFEGKPITDNHPGGCFVNTSNASFYSKGHIQNVRRGSGEQSDMLIADFLLDDPQLIETVERDVKREVSSGYNCQYIPENGKVYQRKIRGNHVAIVSRGRAGSDVAIMDSEPVKKKGKRYMPKSKLFQHVFGLGLKEFAKDAEPEEVSKLVNEKPEETHDDETEAPAAPAPAPQENPLEKILAAIEGLGKRVEALESAGSPKEDAMDELESELDKKDEEEPHKSEAISDEEPDTDDNPDKPKEEGQASDADVVGLIRKLKPTLAKVKDKAVRDSAVNACLDSLHMSRKSVYGSINRAVQSHVKDARPVMSSADRTNAFVENCKKMAEGK